MGERDQNEQGTGEEEREQVEPAEPRGRRIPGRDFAGASYASTEREQTADHRGESERFRMDEPQNEGDEERERPRDES